MLDKGPTLEVSTILQKLSTALEARDVEAAASLFHEDCYWRDLVAFTWNITTMEGRGAIRDMLSAQLDHVDPKGFSLDENEGATQADGVTEGWLVFETKVARGHGHIRLKDGRIWTLLTAARELKGHEEPAGALRPQGVEHVVRRGRKNWAEERSDRQRRLGCEEQPYVVIVGGGQGGIALAARLKRLSVPTIVVESNERPGDSWRKRYKSLCLHDPVWYDHLPYIPFPEHWPVFTPKDQLGDWLEMYTKVMDLDYWTSSRCESASYDKASGEWTAIVNRNGERVELKPRHLVLATGMSGKPNIPAYPGQDIFEGEQQHSSAHPGPDAYAGKRVVVIGSNNSAHDIAAALWEVGADVTMVQRTATTVIRSEPLMELGMGDLYSERALASGMTTEKADMIFASIPYALLADFQKPIYDQIREQDADFYDRLRKAGFMIDFGEDESGLFMKYLRRGSGYYIDVGASGLVADGSIRLESGREVSHLTKDAVVLADGTELPADLVVYATGYGSMNGWVADLISQEMADRVGKCWGLGSGTRKDPGPWEGEPRNMWKPTLQPGLWFHGGNLHQSRHYSLYLAMQLKARMEGIDTPVHALAPSHHKS